MNKKIILSTVLVISSIIAMLFIKFKNDQGASIIRVKQLTELCDAQRTDMLNLYNERQKLLFGWQKISKIKIPEKLTQTYNGELINELDLKKFDELQHQISNQFNLMLQKSEALKKKIRELQIIEEAINKKRVEYHSSAFEASDLIQKFRTGQKPVPVFPAEKMLKSMKK